MLEDDYFLGTKLYYNKFTEICQPLIDYLGITSAHYVNIDKNGKAFVIYSLKKWGERVLEKQHYHVEPVLVHPENIHNGFSIANASEDLLYKNTLLYDGSINFNWWHAFCYIEKTPSNGGFFSLGLATTKDNLQMISKLINEKHLIRNMIRNVHKEICAIKDLEDNRMDLPALKKNNFYSQKGLIFHEKNQVKRKIDILDNIGLTKPGCKEIFIDPQLSSQEINCLRIYMVSHSIKKVSRDLNLQPTTVASYLENIKNKLECNNKEELLEKSKILESLGHI